MRHVSILAVVVALCDITGSHAQALSGSGTFILHLVAKPGGEETYTLNSTPSGLRLQSHFEYLDRGTPVPWTLPSIAIRSRWRFLEVGKRSDILIVNGDPLSSIADLQKVDTVIAGERIYHPAPLLHSVAFRP